MNMKLESFHPMWVWVAIAVMSASYGMGCVVSEPTCDEFQEITSELVQRCTCSAGYVASEDKRSCVPCGENEVVAAAECVCDEGFGRASADAPCKASALGGACTGDADCAPPYEHCANADTDGYCTTKSCTGHGDCAEGWHCMPGTTGDYCERPPIGLNSTCESSEDCADGEALYCEAFQSKTCQVSGCAEGESECHGDWACCDLRSLTGVSLCMPQSALDAEGNCPANTGKPVNQ